MDERVRYPRVRVSGDAHARGVQYGTLAKERILASRNGYEQAFRHATGWNWQQAVESVVHLIEPVRSAFPEYLAEMEGIAQGCGLRFDDIFTMNARTEVIWAATVRRSEPDLARFGRECSSFALMPHRTAMRHTLVGQNWDWLVHSFDTVIVLEVEQPDRPNYVTVVEAGLLAKATMNSAGIGVAVNALVTSLDRADPGIPFHVLIRAFADCRSVTEAISLATNHVRASSGNYLVAHADGTAVNLQTTPGDYRGVLPQLPDDGALVHTNHFTSPLVDGRDVASFAMPDSFVRLQRIESSIAANRAPATVESVTNALSDHADYPTSVCRHPGADEAEAEQWATVASVVMDLDERAMYLSDGNPCEVPYRRLTFDGLLDEAGREHPRPDVQIDQPDAAAESVAFMSGAPPFPAAAQVTLADWQDGPHNRWAFQHIRELIPTVRIARGSGPVRKLAAAPRDVLGIRLRSGGRTLRTAEVLAETYTDGFAVLHRGKLVAEHYANHLTPDTPHLLMSVSKSVTAAVAGILVGDGRLDVTAQVTDVVPELRGTSFAGATVQHLLDMRAGTRFNEDYDDVDSDVRAYERVYLWRPDVPAGRDEPPRPADALEYFATLPNDGPHGGPFRYRSILTDVMAWVLEKASGQRFAELVSAELWQPMGAEFDADITVDARGNALADGGMSASLRDLLRFGALYLPSDTTGLLGRAWVDDTARGAPDGAEAFVAHSRAENFGSGAHYRNYWWVHDSAAPILAAEGIYGQHIYVHGPADLVIVKLSTWPTPTSPAFERLTLDAATAIATAFGEASQ
jgi:isopenicillin-N N-acyltransferase-like protein